MTKYLLCFLLVFIVPFSSCASLSGWWNKTKDDPVAQAQLTISGVEILKSVATATFETVKLQLPPMTQVKAEAEFQKGLLTLSVAESAIQDLINLVADGKEAHPDFTKLFADLSSAITHVQYIVSMYQTMAPVQVMTVESVEQPDAFTKQAEALKARLK